MKVGDLVRDTQHNDVGLVIDTIVHCTGAEAYKVLFSDGEEWLNVAFLEVINA